MIVQYNLFAIVWALIILVLTLTSGATGANLDYQYLDKVVHLLMFSILSLLLTIGYTKQYTYRYLRFNAGKSAVLTAGGYGIILELIQAILPARSFELSDIMANFIGAIIGYLMFYLIYKLA